MHALSTDGDTFYLSQSVGKGCITPASRITQVSAILAVISRLIGLSKSGR
jgi:hypothetical protein